MAKHIFVIDTCVLLHDPNSIHKFSENDIYIPLAVIDDLDELKTKKEQVGWSAREVFRKLDKYNIPQMLKGVAVNEEGGKLFIYNTQAPLQKNERPTISRVNSDNAIIDAAIALKSQNPKRKVVVVTKDTGLRVRAISWGCQAENYKADLLEKENFYTGYRYIDVNESTVWDKIWKNSEFSNDILSSEIQKQTENAAPHEFFIFKFGEQSCITKHLNGVYEIIEDKKNKKTQSYQGIVPKNLEQKLAARILSDEHIPLVTLSGPAGSGKSLLALAVGLEGINNGLYDRLVVIKPMIAVGGKDIGFLPGDKFEKIAAWLGPIRDNLMQLVCSNSMERGVNSVFEDMVEQGIIEVEAMAFIQGRSIPNSFIMVDEAENLTPREARMVVERCGTGSKVVLLGDLTQIENPYLDSQSCGLSHAINGGRYHAVAGNVTLSKVERSVLAAAATQIFIQSKPNF